MIARISQRMLVLQEIYAHWDAQEILREVNEVLLRGKRSAPKYFFEGSPVVGHGGISIVIKLDEDLSQEERRALRRLLAARGFKVIEEDRL
ncbi:MAG: hypothetical protein ABWK00_01320 [Desulfurococcaceae archaeon]